MTVVIMLTLTAAMIGTAFLSGIFGMAGGLILIGILLIPLPVREAMALHAITQMASNGWRGLLWLRYVRWRSASFFLIGSAVSFFCWALIQFVPSKPVAFILLGLLPLLIRLAPARIKPNPGDLMWVRVRDAIALRSDVQTLVRSQKSPCGVHLPHNPTKSIARIRQADLTFGDGDHNPSGGRPVVLAATGRARTRSR